MARTKANRDTDLLAAFFSAEGDFHREDVARGLKTLKRHCESEDLPARFRRRFLRRIGTLREANKKLSPELARTAVFKEGDERIRDERQSPTQRLSVDLTRAWNRLVEKCALAIDYNATRARLEKLRQRMQTPKGPRGRE